MGANQGSTNIQPFASSGTKCHLMQMAFAMTSWFQEAAHPRAAQTHAYMPMRPGKGPATESRRQHKEKLHKRRWQTAVHGTAAGSS